jgi:hypothetical protein
MEDQASLGLFELSRWRVTRNWLIWGFVPGVLLASNLINWITHLRYSFFIAVAIWMIATAYTVRRVQLWPCPHCGKPVMKRAGSTMTFRPSVCTAGSRSKRNSRKTGL